MIVTVEIRDQLAQSFAAQGGKLTRAALEAMAFEGYCADRHSEYEVRQLLGFESRMDVHGFFKEHGVYLRYTMEDLEHDIREAGRYSSPKAANNLVENSAG